MITSSSRMVHQPARSEEEHSDYSRRWIIIILLALGAVLAFISRTNISAALAYKPFVQAFHLTDIDRGSLNAAFFWSYAVLQIPTGWLVDRYGVKIPYAISFVIWCLASAATGVTRSVSQLAALRMVTGAGEAIVTPASYCWIRRNFAENEGGLAIGIYMVGTKIGPAIGAPLAIWLIQAYSWRLMFILIGIVGMIWIFPWMFMVKNDRPGAGQLTPEKKRARKAASVPLRNLVTSPVMWGTIVISFSYNYFVFFCMSWMPAYLVEQRHLSLSKSGLYSFFSFIGIAIVAIAGGWIADLMIKKLGWHSVLVRKTFVVAGFVIGCTELLGVRAASLHSALFWVVVSLSGLGLATANMLALCRLTLIPKEAVGLVTGIQNVATSLAGIASPLISGWLLQRTGNYMTPMLAIFFFQVLGAMVCVVTLREKWAPKVAGAPAASCAVSAG